MDRPVLLIVDGESLRTPGFEQVLGQAGWDLMWASHQEAGQVCAVGMLPSLLLLDPVRGNGAGLAAVRAIQAQNPGLPMVIMRGASGGEAGVMAPNPGGYLDRDFPMEEWPALLEGFLAPAPLPSEEHKLTAEDLFGDILADMEGLSTAPTVEDARGEDAQATAILPEPAALPVPMEPPPPHVPPAPIPRPPVKPAPLPPLPAFNPVAPRPAHLPKPMAKPTAPVHVPVVHVPLAKPFAQEGAPRPVVEHPLVVPIPAAPPETPKKEERGPDEYTLSGFSGIHDPFEVEFMGNVPSPVAGVTPQSTPPQPPLAEAAPSLDPQQGQILEEFGNYYLMEKIAVGGMAELFKAKQRGPHNFQKIVAIKRILPHLSDNDEFVHMFIDEAKLAAQLTHPNIVQIFDLGKASGFYYIAMEFVDGRDLRSLLRKVREYRIPFPEPVAAYVAMKVAAALDYAHRKRGMNDKELKLVHRDISPQNILISTEGAVKLVDFGIAKAATKSTQTMAGALKGKLLYMSPEQALGQHLDSRSDIYSLGLVLFELLTGERCFQADSELGVLEKVRLGRVLDVQAINPNVSRAMANIVQKALQKNVESRYPSARFLERDLRSLLLKQGNEPTEHDVAEYANTLLRGTKEQLEELVAARFAVAQAAPRSRMEDHPTTVEIQPQKPELVPIPLPPPEIEMDRPARPRWILPVAGFLLVLVLVLIWIAIR